MLIKRIVLILAGVLSATLSMVSAEAVSNVYAVLASVLPDSVGMQRYTTDQISNVGHALAYLLITLLAVATLNRNMFLVAMLPIGLAGSLELIQSFIPGRVASWSDFGYGAAGIAAAVCLMGAIRCIRSCLHKRVAVRSSTIS